MARAGNNHKGGAPTSYDRNLAKEIRNLTLNKTKQIFNNDPEVKEDFTKQLLLRLAPNAIPRLVEGPGDDGEHKFDTLLVKIIGNDKPDNNGDTV